jgi:hypothetical protein
MSRRRGNRWNTVPDYCNGLTHTQYANAKGRITRLEAAYIREVVPIPFTAMDLVRWLWPTEVVEACLAAYGKIHEPPRNAFYPNTMALPNYPGPLGEVSSSMVSFYLTRPPTYATGIIDLLPIVLPAQSMMRPSQGGHGAHITALETMYEIHAKFNEARAVLDFLVQFTPGALRATWPTIMSLVPNERSPLHEAGVRHKAIPGLGEWVQRIRESSGIIASSLLLPEREAPANMPKWTAYFHNSQAFPLV